MHKDVVLCMSVEHGIASVGRGSSWPDQLAHASTIVRWGRIEWNVWAFGALISLRMHTSLPWYAVRGVAS